MTVARSKLIDVKVTRYYHCGGMGLLHGHAHGTEMPMMATAALYSVGFMTCRRLLLHKTHWPRTV